MNEANPQNAQSIKAVFKKIRPFWIAAVIAAGFGIILIRAQSVRLINYIQYPEADPTQLVETLRVEAQKNHRAAAEQWAMLKDNPRRAEDMKNSSELRKARRLLLECLKLKPDMPAAFAYLADLAMFEDDKIQMFYYQGRRALAEGQYAEALEAFDEALKLKSDDRSVLLEKGRAYIQLKNFPEAHKIIETLLKLDSPDAESFYLKAQLAAQETNHHEYRIALEQALARDPVHIPSAKAFSEIIAAENKVDEAIAILEKARPAAPRDANLLHRLANLHALKGDYKTAEKTFLAALEFEKNSPWLYLDFSRLYEKMGKKSHASAMLQKAVELEPSLVKE